MKEEIQRRQSNLDRVEALFRSHEGEWIEARDFEIPGGRQAWRSRIAECRTQRAMYIENRQERDTNNRVVASYYRYRPQPPIGRESTRPDPAAEKHPATQLPLLETRPR